MQERAILAGGCFWGMEDLIRKLPGVVDTTVGYTGGALKNPTYEDMKSPSNRHAEAIEIFFEPAHITYRQLLEFFFQIHNPTTPDRQGNDIGPSYRSAIFYLDDAQRQTAETLVSELNDSAKFPARIVTEITPALEFYPAEDYHQDYLERYPDGYTCHFIRPNWKL